ncbi:MAG: 2OG-Fe(II) oxygenase [Wenzhouxiangellaceae bacterium]|nr:MAG: 2OG-Fe(II) oxygenase [Wenzhouxiangellaceae bacterium]
MNQVAHASAAELARQAVIEALEHRLAGRAVPEEQLLALGRQLPAFARAWLAHAIGSETSAAELALAMALAVSQAPDELDQLIRFWDAVNTPGIGLPSALRDRLAGHGLSLDARHVDLWGRMSGLPRPSVDSDTPVATAGLPIKPGRLGLVRARARPHLRPAEVYGQQRGERKQQIRDSDQAILPPPSSDCLLASLERMMAAATGQGLAAAEPLVILRYRPGQQYRWHRDYIQPTTPELVEEIRRFGQRVHTVIAYLSADFDGGETEFRDWNLSLRPGAGQCLSFSSVRADGSLAPESIHRGAPVKRGEKWIATLWYRARPLWNRSGLLAS